MARGANAGRGARSRRAAFHRRASIASRPIRSSAARGARRGRRRAAIGFVRMGETCRRGAWRDRRGGCGGHRRARRLERRWTSRWNRPARRTATAGILPHVSWTHVMTASRGDTRGARAWSAPPSHPRAAQLCRHPRHPPNRWRTATRTRRCLWPRRARALSTRRARRLGSTRGATPARALHRHRGCRRRRTPAPEGAASPSWRPPLSATDCGDRRGASKLS